jgi:molecular chaperone DnaK
MIADAEEYVDDDRIRKETIEIRNAADSALYTAERALTDMSDKTSQDTQALVKNHIEGLQQALQENDNKSIRDMTDALQKEIQNMGVAASSQPDNEMGTSPEQEDSGTADQTDDKDVVDAEFDES